MEVRHPPTSGTDPKWSEKNEAGGNARFCREQTAIRIKINPAPRSKRFSIAKGFMISFIAILVPLTMIILNFFSKINQETRFSSPQSWKEIIRNSARRMSVSESPVKDGGSTTSQDRSKTNGSHESGRQHSHYYEIYLKSGNIIITEYWWEKNDMILHKVNHGTMGIEKSSVEKIIGP
ncbi:MAG: hypothetical protein JSW39_07205 [Desulfobacterales bacterium]|nr:MAG: hypothetical protein JSW39_07205 [Desulfobacterales bacterium]